MHSPYHYTVTIDDFKQIIDSKSSHEKLALADSIDKEVPIYLAENLLKNHDQALSELAYCLDQGPGVFVIKKGFDDLSIIDAYQAVIDHIITQEKQTLTNQGDHFAKAGANDRVWNALQKCCLENPEAHIHYYANALIALAAKAWLGPCYQITSQINVVKPGGKAQMPHRDYHLGFQTNEQCAKYPPHVQRLSAYLTLQGAVAQTDMPIESGPTLLLPYSQRYELGYLSWRDQAFIDYFHENAIQLPLEKGDLLFFNPALFHAAGENKTSSVNRCANLLQISSAFGIPMESINREKMSLACYESLLTLSTKKKMTPDHIHNVIAATADGYSFATNLDNDQPIDGLAPQTMQALIAESIQAQKDHEDFKKALLEMAKRREA